MAHSGIFIKLDAEYASDDEIIEAGPLAELLFIRALAFCKRKRLDGVITRSQLTSVSLGIPNPTRHAATLCSVGLWAEAPSGWTIPSWLKHNKSAEELAADKEARRQASVEANHAQHHVGPGKKKSPKCELCRPATAPKSEPKSEADRTRDRLQEPEGEVEPEGEPQGEGEAEGQFQSLATSTVGTRPAGSEDDFNDPSGIENVVTVLGNRFRMEAM